jgi:hypothetical protein
MYAFFPFSAREKLIISRTPQTAFGIALKPLKKLHTLHLGVCLSDARVLDEHVIHSIDINSPRPSSPPPVTYAGFALPSSPVSTDGYGSDRINPCDIHSDNVPCYPGSCRHSLCQEALQITSLREVIAAGVIARELGNANGGMGEEKSLAISWSSAFSCSNEKGGTHVGTKWTPPK